MIEAIVIALCIFGYSLGSRRVARAQKQQDKLWFAAWEEGLAQIKEPDDSIPNVRAYILALRLAEEYNLSPQAHATVKFLRKKDAQ